MSRVGNKIIEIDQSVEVNISDQTVLMKGPKGELSCEIDPSISIFFEENKLYLKRNSDKKDVKAKHGLYRALIANIYIGVLQGFESALYLSGIGYRVALKGKNLEFSLGYSHPIIFEAEDGIEFSVEGQDKLTVKGIDKQLVGEVCAKIKKLRRKDVYKAKGIHFVGDRIVKKLGKKIKK